MGRLNIRRQAGAAIAALAAVCLVFVGLAPAQAADPGLPGGWVQMSVSTPRNDSPADVVSGGALQVAPDGTIRYLATTEATGRAGQFKIWQRSPAGVVQQYDLPTGMLRDVSPGFQNPRWTYLGKPDATGGYLVVQYATSPKTLRSAYVPSGVDPGTIASQLEPNGASRAPEMLMTNSAGDAALVVNMSTHYAVIFRPHGATTSFGPTRNIAPSESIGIAKMFWGGSLDPDGSAFVLAGDTNSHDILQILIKPDGTWPELPTTLPGVGTIVARYNAADNGRGIVVWDRTSDGGSRKVWAQTRVAGGMLGDPVLINANAVNDYFDGVIRRDGAGAVIHAPFASAKSCSDSGTTFPAGLQPWITTIGGTPSDTDLPRGDGSEVNPVGVASATAGSKVAAVYVDQTYKPNDACNAAKQTWVLRAATGTQPSELAAPVSLYSQSIATSYFPEVAMNANGVVAVLVRMVAINSGNPLGARLFVLDPSAHDGPGTQNPGSPANPGVPAQPPNRTPACKAAIGQQAQAQQKVTNATNAVMMAKGKKKAKAKKALKKAKKARAKASKVVAKRC